MNEILEHYETQAYAAQSEMDSAFLLAALIADIRLKLHGKRPRLERIFGNINQQAGEFK